MTHTLDISPHHLQCVKDILRHYIPDNTEIWVFGSRITDKAKPFSDLDIAIACADHRPLTQTELLDLEEAFNESPLPWKVDIVDMHQITKTFYDIINQNKILLDL